jgi:cell division septum initiation protein DivIVA
MSTGGDRLDPDRLEHAEFPVVRRGFEQEMVRSQLGIAADEVRRLRNIVAGLEQEITALESRPSVDLEAERITEAIGEEAVRVLDAARTAAIERAARAEAEAADVITGAERTADDLRAEAEADRDRILEQARLEAEKIVEQGRARGRDMVNEAQTVRERMLRDLAAKRQTHRAEVEQLRAGRDRLLESLVDAQQTLDHSVAELVSSVPEAQAAAERAGLRVNGEPELTVEQLEAEIATARLVEHPLVEGLVEPGFGDETELYDAAADSPSSAMTDDGEGSVDGVVTDDGEGSVGEEVADDGEVSVGEEVADDGEVSVGEEEPADDEESAGVDELFDRLRSSHIQAVAEGAATVPPTDPSEPDEIVLGEVAGLEPAEDLEVLEEIVLAEGSEEVEESSESRDEAARDEAVEEIARSLKRLIVDEQGDLLDGLRRDGTTALRVVLERDEGIYSGVLIEPLQGMTAVVAGEGVEIPADGAVSSLHAHLLEPVRSRLAEALEETDDPDELSTTVRAVYRECRSRRVDEAAAAAVAVVFERALETRSSTPT